MIEEAIERGQQKQDLSREESKAVFDEIMRGKAETEQIASFLKALAEKRETVDEIVGAAESMKAAVAAVKPKVDSPLLDIVGTGGDKKHAINVSTASAFVAAGAGCYVAKHGNRSVSSKCGSADVLERLGVNIECSSEKNAELIEKIGIAFMFAPCHHPAMKYAMPARRQLGIRTIFNILGPITNPAHAETFLLGVFDLGLAEKLASVLSRLDIKKALVVHGNDGFDEISLSCSTTVFEVAGKSLKRYEISPGQFGFALCNEEDVKGEDAVENARVLKSILEGKEQGPKRDIVLLNSGAAVYANWKAESIASGIEKARQSIDSGSAMQKLRQLVEESNR